MTSKNPPCDALHVFHLWSFVLFAFYICRYVWPHHAGFNTGCLSRHSCDQNMEGPIGWMKASNKPPFPTERYGKICEENREKIRTWCQWWMSNAMRMTRFERLKSTVDFRRWCVMHQTCHSSGVILLPMQTRHYCKWNLSKFSHKNLHQCLIPKRGSFELSK